MAVVRRQIRGPIGNQRVEHLPRRQTSDEGLVVPAATGHPVAIGIGRRPGSNRLLDDWKRPGFEQVDLIERETAADQVCVRVVEAGNDRASTRVDDDGLGTAQPLDLAARPDLQNLVPLHRHGFGHRSVAVGRVHAAIDNDEIDRPS